uniref:Uncharacterized protein n=1 Tax=Aegilops tauschii TaxID=37682 RepID=M8B9R0_AEGTA
MASKSLAFVCVIFAFLVIVSQGVVAARDLTHVNRAGGNNYGGGWSGSYGGRRP